MLIFEDTKNLVFHSPVFGLHVVRFHGVKHRRLDSLCKTFISSVICVARTFRTNQRFNTASIVLYARVAMNAQEQICGVCFRHLRALRETEVRIGFARKNNFNLVIPDFGFVQNRFSHEKRHA